MSFFCEAQHDLWMDGVLYGIGFASRPANVLAVPFSSALPPLHRQSHPSACKVAEGGGAVAAAWI
jgi:hypothetical protein